LSFQYYIARRYLNSKKSHNAINVISAISVIGVAIATAALICILSVFNGFRDMVASLFTDFDPQIKIVSNTGKYMSAESKELLALKKNPKIMVYTESIEDNALLVYNNRQIVATIKGVDDNFEELTNIDNILYGDGTFELHADVIDYGVPGVGILSQLDAMLDFQPPIQVYAPKKGEKIDMVDPRESFNHEELYSPRVAFQVKQKKYDSNYVLTSLDFARRLFDKDGQLTSVELRLQPNTDISKAKKEFKELLGDGYKVNDRYEQQEDTFKIMKIEKLISYIFLTFILLIACFNVIGSLSMLIIDKKNDISTMRNLGATDKQISGIFLYEGRMISFIGAVIGILVGLLLCWLQDTYGFVRFGSSEGSYIINAYPVSVHFWDVVLVFVTVIVVGFISVWYPVKRLSKAGNDQTQSE